VANENANEHLHINNKLMTDVVANGTILGSAAEGKKSQRKFRYLVAVIGFVLVALELMLALDEVAVYQSLICSAYLLFNILIDVSAWTERYWTRKFGRKTNIAEGRLIFGAILIPSWLLFNRLLGLIAPLFSYVVIWSLSFAIIIVLTLSASLYGFVVKRRDSKIAHDIAQKVYEPTRKRRHFHQASVRTVILLSPIMILVGILLLYLGWFTSVFHTKLGLLEAQVGAFGVTLILMGTLLPIARMLQERSRRLKRAQKALQRKNMGEAESV